MAIFKRVGCYYSHVLEGTCIAGFFCILHVVTLLYVSICGVEHIEQYSAAGC
jgi:hypothetical protein